MGERVVDSVNVAESDMVTFSENVWRAKDVHNSKNVILSDSVVNSEFVAGGYSANTCTYSAKVSGSLKCSACFMDNWGNGNAKSLFMESCENCYECMFSTYLKGKSYCIANMQFEKEEYFKIKEQVVKWILSV